MSTVTDITTQQKNKNRVNIFIDGEYSFAIEKLSMLKYGLRIGAVIDSKQIQESIFDSECSCAFGRCVDYLSRGIKTAKQMTTYLSSKGYDSTVVQVTLDKLKSYRYINDTSYATSYFDTNIVNKGTRRIRQELTLKGVDRSIIDGVCDSCDSRQLDNATSLATKYLRAKTIDAKTLLQLNRYLLSRGYDYDIVNNIVSSYRVAPIDDCE